MKTKKKITDMWADEIDVDMQEWEDEMNAIWCYGGGGWITI
ncbi:MAG: hypothetical protein QW575_08660 [Thermoproteota archaeon]